jgi:hypothetical protein
MNKFSIGDRIVYTNKRDFGQRELHGVVAADLGTGGFVICAERYGAISFTFGGLYGTPYPLHHHRINNFQLHDPYYFEQQSLTLLRPKLPTYIVPKSSKNLRHAYKPYDPEQQPFDEGDI